MTAAEMFCERVLDGITNWDKPKDRQDEENVSKSKGEGEKEKVEKLADGGNAESAIDAALAYLEREGDEPTRRNVFAKDWALKKPDGKGKTSKTAQDELYEALVEDAETLTDKTLAEHDKERHPHGYHEGDTCKFREKMMVETEADKADEVDADKVGRETTGTAEQPIQAENKRESFPVDKPQAKIYEGLSKKKVEKYKGQMAKKHPELDADLILTELAKIKDPKLQGDAFAWVMKGAIKLPEDMYKVEQARELATKAKRDPLQWDTPQACIEELLGEGHRVKEKPITVEELKKNPLMSDYRDEGFGVETFQVDDSREGQQLMRQVLNTHWGKDANPWCLLHGDGEGNLSDGSDGRYDAWQFWQQYNALPKRVAFKDGKLLAFMGTDEKPQITDEILTIRDEDFERYDEYLATNPENPLSRFEWFKANADLSVREQWWDRMDGKHKGIPIGEVEAPNDELHRKIPCGEIRGGKIVIPEGQSLFIGEKDKPGYTRWSASNPNQKIEEIDSEGNRTAWYENGNVASIKKTDGTKKTFYKNGKKKDVITSDSSTTYSIDGVKISEYKKLGGGNEEIRTWDFEGNLTSEETNGIMRSYIGGELEDEHSKDGSYKKVIRNEDGEVVRRVGYDAKTITHFRYYPDWSIQRIEYPNGDFEGRFPDGDIQVQRRKGVTESWHRNGNRELYKDSNGTWEWDEDGNLVKGEGIPPVSPFLEKQEHKTAQDELVSALLGENYVEDAETLPQGETLEEHDRKKHKGHFDPSTQTCKFREEMKKETETDRADEISPESAPKAEGGEEVGQNKPLVSPEEDKAYMEAVERGDMETAAKMVREVAGRAFPNTKVIDKDGKPLIVYHGSNSQDEITEFDTADDDRGGKTDFTGAWFTPTKSIAQSFADNIDSLGEHGKVYSVFLNIQNPYQFDAKFRPWDKLKREKEVREEYKEVTFKYPSSLMRKGGKPHPQWYKTELPIETTQEDIIKAGLERIRHLDSHGDRLIKKGGIWDGYEDFEKYIAEKLKNGGDDEVNVRARVLSRIKSTMTTDELAREIRKKGINDGVIIDNVKDAGGSFSENDGFENDEAYHGYDDDYGKWGITDIIVFSGRNIKSADPVTYDDDGNIIPLSRRFDDGDDIRGDVKGGGDGNAPSSVEKEESEDLESYDKNFTEDGEWKSPWNNGGPTFDTRKSVGVARNPWTKASRDEAEMAAQMLKRVLGGVTVGFSDKPYEGEGDTRKSIGGIFTGTSADYANESRQGGVGDGPSLMKIGSGEGSQVYGWGLYGSTVRGVAEGYARQGRNLNVAAGDAEYELDGKSLDRKNDVIDSALTYLASERMNTQKAIEEVNRAIDGFKRQLEDTNERLEWDKNNFRLQIDAESLPKRIRHLNEVKGFIERDGRKIRQVLPSENIYEQTFFTNREPGDESHLLNWYEPVRDEQVEWIQKKLKENYDFGITESGKLYSLYGATGADVYNSVKELLEEKGGIHNSPEATSRFLAEAGIDGVKYPVDSYGGKSIKNGNEAGWNYVSFRDDNIRVDNKWVDGEQRYFRNKSGKVVGEYDRNTNKITLYPGATVRDVVHEYSHGLWQFAEQEAEAGRGELLDKMKSIADTASEEVKSAVAANYEEVTPDVYLEECFTHEMARRSDTAFAKAIGSKEGKPWYKRAWGAIKDAWKGLATKMGLNKADISKIGKMSDGDAAEHILSQMMEGRRFGEVKGKGADESRKAVENDAVGKDKPLPENLKFIESIELPNDDDLIAFSEHTKKIRERMRKNQIELNNTERINNEAVYCSLADKVCEDGIILAQESLSLLGFDESEIDSNSSSSTVSVTHGIPGMLSNETLEGLSSVLSRFPILKGGCDFYAWETTSKRSYWDSLGINVNRGSAFRTYLHESGHWIEENDEDVHDLCVDFLKYRTDGEPFVHLGADFLEVVKHGDWMGHFKSEVPITHNMLTDPEYEIGKKDRFRNSYAGKFYCQESDVSDATYKLDATEILSMGIQDLLQNPVSFIKTDSQYARFVLGVLRRQNPLEQKRYNFA